MLQVIEKTMTPEQFCYWLQGYTELQVGKVGITRDQWQIIQDHLKEVFHKKTPDYYDLRQNVHPVTTTTEPIPLGENTFIC